MEEVTLSEPYEPFIDKIFLKVKPNGDGYHTVRCGPYLKIHDGEIYPRENYDNYMIAYYDVTSQIIADIKTPRTEKLCLENNLKKIDREAIDKLDSSNPIHQHICVSGRITEDSIRLSCCLIMKNSWMPCNILCNPFNEIIVKEAVRNIDAPINIISSVIVPDNSIFTLASPYYLGRYIQINPNHIRESNVIISKKSFNIMCSKEILGMEVINENAISKIESF